MYTPTASGLSGNLQALQDAVAANEDQLARIDDKQETARNETIAIAVQRFDSSEYSADVEDRRSRIQRETAEMRTQISQAQAQREEDARKAEMQAGKLQRKANLVLTGSELDRIGDTVLRSRGLFDRFSNMAFGCTIGDQKTVFSPAESNKALGELLAIEVFGFGSAERTKIAKAVFRAKGITKGDVQSESFINLKAKRNIKKMGFRAWVTNSTSPTPPRDTIQAEVVAPVSKRLRVHHRAVEEAESSTSDVLETRAIDKIKQEASEDLIRSVAKNAKRKRVRTVSESDEDYEDILP